MFITMLLFVYQGSLDDIEYPPSLHVCQSTQIMTVQWIKGNETYGPPVAMYSEGGETEFALYLN